jgi:hypothetical protein
MLRLGVPGAARDHQRTRGRIRPSTTVTLSHLEIDVDG